MTYIINGRFFSQKVTGVQRYARELLKQLDNLIESDNVEIAIPSYVSEMPQYKNIKIVEIDGTNGIQWEQVAFPSYVRKKKGVSINLCNASPLVSPGIVCLHDVKIKARPKDFNRVFLIWYNLLFYNACKHALRIITVSDFSKNELVKYYKVDPHKITVIPDAWQHYSYVTCCEDTLKR